MFFTFPEGARWNADRQAVEFGVEIGEYPGSRGECSNCYRKRPPRAVRGGVLPTAAPGSRASPNGSCAGVS
jgi:hypothetical protein